MDGWAGKRPEWRRIMQMQFSGGVREWERDNPTKKQKAQSMANQRDENEVIKRTNGEKEGEGMIRGEGIGIPFNHFPPPPLLFGRP